MIPGRLPGHLAVPAAAPGQHEAPADFPGGWGFVMGGYSPSGAGGLPFKSVRHPGRVTLWRK